MQQIVCSMEYHQHPGWRHIVPEGAVVADLLAEANALHTEERLFEDTEATEETGEGEDAAEEDEGDDPREQPDGEQHELPDDAADTEWRNPPGERLAPQGSSRVDVTTHSLSRFSH